MKLRQLLIPGTLSLLLTCGTFAVAQTRRTVESATAAEKVTVTLVRWPYT
jgi:hypothetical protein